MVHGCSLICFIGKGKDQGQKGMVLFFQKGYLEVNVYRIF